MPSWMESTCDGNAPFVLYGKVKATYGIRSMVVPRLFLYQEGVLARFSTPDCIPASENTAFRARLLQLPADRRPASWLLSERYGTDCSRLEVGWKPRR